MVGPRGRQWHSGTVVFGLLIVDLIRRGSATNWVRF
jgi:hypothetical protein